MSHVEEEADRALLRDIKNEEKYTLLGKKTTILQNIQFSQN